MTTVNRTDQALASPKRGHTFQCHWAYLTLALAAASLAGCGESASTPAIGPGAFIRPSSPPVASAAPNGPAPDAPLPPSTQPLSGPGLRPVVATFPPSVTPGRPRSVAALLGTVNGQPLFVQDILAPIAAQLAGEAATSRTQAYFKQRATASIARELRLKIDNLLMLHAAERQLSRDQRREIAVWVARKKAKLVAQYFGSEEMADQALRQHGSSLQKTLRHFRHKLIVEMYVDGQLLPSIIITRRQIWAYYQRHLKKFTRPAQISLYTITYPVIRQWPRDPNDPTHTQPIRHPTPAQVREACRKALAYCQQLENRIRHGADFAVLAQDNSVDYQAQNGGHWANLRRGTLSNLRLEKKAFALPPHTMAPPLLIANKQDPRRDVVVIMRVGAVQHHRVIPFAVAQKTINQKLRDRQFRRLMHRYYQRMYSQAAIAARAQMLRTALSVATALYYPRASADENGGSPSSRPG